jgi:hypothetical protein
LGIIPVIVTNRYINLDVYAHYGLPASLAAAIFLGGLIYLLRHRYLRFAFFSAAILLASLTHYAISKRALNQENAVKEFWWQVNWRIPALYPDASLVTQYPYEDMLGGSEFALLEPANVIYFPEPREELPIRYPVSALNPNDEITQYIETGHPQEMGGHRTHKTIFIYKNALLLTQPTFESCVRVIDGTKYLPAELDSENVKHIAPFSNIGIIRSRAEPRTPQTFAFGAEPARGWCYYFEKADFAVQQGQWKEAAELGNEALRRGYSPADPVEWFPFLQAYIMTDNADTIARIASEMNKSAFVKEHACLLSASASLDPKIQNAMTALFCK